MPNHDILRLFGDKLRKQRLKSDLTLKEACQGVGMDQGALSKVESGIHGVPIEKIIKFCALYQCTPNDLIPLPGEVFDVERVAIPVKTITTFKIKPQ